jgi:uncharacterized protein YndB with AHSA1/START domain
METSKIKVDAVIHAGIDKMWKYYTQGEHIINWNFASDDWCCPKADVELHAGGKYLARMEAKDGSFGFDFEAIINTVNEPKFLSYTLFDNRQVEINFESMIDKTYVSVVFDAENLNPVEMQKDGWQAILNSFKKYTESN